MNQTEPTIITVTVTLADEERQVEFKNYGKRASSVENVAYGVFPTGSKAHRTGLRIVAMDAYPKRPRNVKVVTAEDGSEWVLDTTLYTHNRNNGRIVGWADSVSDEYIARWK